MSPIISNLYLSNILGAAAALASAFCWAISAVLFKSLSQWMSAVAMNFFKGLVALIWLSLLLLVTGFSDIGFDSVYILSLSGLLGICLGDTLFFMALIRLGARLTLLLGMLIPVLTAIFAIIFIGEILPVVAWVGLVMTLSGVGYVLWERSSSADDIRWRSGLAYGFLFVLLNAVSIVLTKIGVAEVAAVEATFIRQLVAVIGLFFFGVVSASLVKWTLPLKNRSVLKLLILAAFIGALLGTWLSIVALKYTQTAVAATLNSTSPLFVLLIIIWVLKEKVGVRAIVGAIVAWLGVGVYFFSFLS